MVYELIGVNWVMAGIVKEELWAWKDLSEKKKCLALILLAIFWMMQKEQNGRIFDGVEEAMDKL